MYFFCIILYLISSGVEAGYNTSTTALRVLGGYEKGTWFLGV
jgi:hypothetical protein